jgi:hypothetical protein
VSDAERRVVVIGPPDSGASEWLAALGAYNTSARNKPRGDEGIRSLDDATAAYFRSARERLEAGDRFDEARSSTARRWKIAVARRPFECVDLPWTHLTANAPPAARSAAIEYIAKADALLLCVDLQDNVGLGALYEWLAWIVEELGPKLALKKFGLLATNADARFGGRSDAVDATKQVTTDDFPRWLRAAVQILVDRTERDESHAFWVSVRGFDEKGNPNSSRRGGVGDRDAWAPVNLVEPLQWIAQPTRLELEAVRREREIAESIRLRAVREAEAAATRAKQELEWRTKVLEPSLREDERKRATVRRTATVVGACALVAAVIVIAWVSLGESIGALSPAPPTPTALPAGAAGPVRNTSTPIGR